jgi:hypothetical protein
VPHILQWRTIVRNLLTAAALTLVALLGTPFAAANVITDWDEKAVAMASPAAIGQREVAMVHVAMFDAVNSIERRYQPYLVQLQAAATASVDAAAASAAGTVLRELHPDLAGDIDAALAKYLAAITASGAAKSAGIELGASVAAKILLTRKQDGAAALDSYRLETKPGAYVPTMTMVGSTWSTVKPFALRGASQFRPSPPVSLTSSEWAADYNEVLDYGARRSGKRTAQQTETARFWLMVGTPAYHPVARQLAVNRRMSVIDSARFMALYSVALADAYIAVFDAKYHYAFWRPLTAIRSADIDGNPATSADPSWQPIAETPMHPEYPCAHCIQSGAARAVIQSVIGSNEIGSVTLTSTTAPGVTHSWKNLSDFTDEVVNARVWAGFHFRFSGRVGTNMGMQIGEFTVQNAMRPAPHR